MKINEENYMDQLQKHNERALLYVIDEYGGTFKSGDLQKPVSNAGLSGGMHE